jgi:transposase
MEVPMAARLSRKRLPRYGLEFKLRTVRLTRMPGMEVQAVAAALDLHPVMVSRWRQEFREGRLKDAGPEPKISKQVVREIRRLQELEKAHKLLLEEHELLKQAIRFCSERRPTSSRSSTAVVKASR